MNKQQIKDLALSNGFKLKQQPNGKMDLNPYVYDFAEALLEKADERVKELEQNQLPIENGENRYGLDVSYFRNVINRELNRSLDNYKPDELARVLARISRTADKSVMFEPEFSNKFAIEQQHKGVEDYKKSDEFCRLLDSHFNSGKVYGHNEYYEQLRKEQE